MKPGTRVVCVDDSMRPEVAEWQPKYCPNWVKLDAKYTIREFDDNDGIVDGVLLEEVSNPMVYLTKWNRYIEPRFATWRFREIDEAESTEVNVKEKEIQLTF